MRNLVEPACNGDVNDEFIRSFEEQLRIIDADLVDICGKRNPCICFEYAAQVTGIGKYIIGNIRKRQRIGIILPDEMFYLCDDDLPRGKPPSILFFLWTEDETCLYKI